MNVELNVCSEIWLYIYDSILKSKDIYENRNCLEIIETRYLSYFA